MFYRGKIQLLLFFCLIIGASQALAQNVFNNATATPGSSDNTGGNQQPGSEVLSSTPGVGVVFEAGGTFEHVGQFYVAGDGIWNHSSVSAESIDYFGYAPRGLGSYLPYQGLGIKGASSVNGGKGAGRPSFCNLELNSTGIFPVVAGMYIAKSLVFNANGPAKSNVISTPNSNTPDSPANAVVFAPTATIAGVNKENYINGFASVTDAAGAFTLPLGDATDASNPLHTLTINRAVGGTVTARYLQVVQQPTTSFGTGISWVSPVGSWPVSAPAGSNVTVTIPALNLSADEADYLRLVGWNGQQWIDLSGTSTPGSCVTGDCPLTGTLTAGITNLGIGLSRNPANGLSLKVWPNPTQSLLYLTVAADKIIREVQVFDQQGHSVLVPSSASLRSGLDVSVLPSGSYLIEVRTTEGVALRQRFIRQ